MLASGFLVYRLAKPVGIPIPFDLRDGHTLLLLLGVAPVLEELIFRMALWESFSAFSRKVRFALIGTTLLFAGGHFAAYPFVPEAYRGFVIYQTLYVLVLGAVAGLRRSKTGAVAPAIGVHFAFNFGFFLGGI